MSIIFFDFKHNLRISDHFTSKETYNIDN